MDWYYLKNDRTLGPVPESSIRAWLESGFLSPYDLLWRAGLPEWTPVMQLAEFGAVPVASGQVRRREAVMFDEVGQPGVAVSYAGFWLRAGAALTDWILLSTVLVLVFRPQFPAVTSLEEMQSAIQALQANPMLLAFSFVLPWLYFAALESSPWQATLGKKAFRIRVTNLHGGRIGPVRATLRHAFKVLLMDATFFLSFLPAAFTARKQAIHDIITGCLVVKA